MLTLGAGAMVYWVCGAGSSSGYSTLDSTPGQPKYLGKQRRIVQLLEHWGDSDEAAGFRSVQLFEGNEPTDARTF